MRRTGRRRQRLARRARHAQRAVRSTPACTGCSLRGQASRARVGAPHRPDRKSPAPWLPAAGRPCLQPFQRPRCRRPPPPSRSTGGPAARSRASALRAAGELGCAFSRGHLRRTIWLALLSARPRSSCAAALRRPRLADTPRPPDPCTPRCRSGSCWAWAALAAVESKVLIQYKKTAAAFPLDLAEEQLVDCFSSAQVAAGTACDGGFSDEALSWVARRGVVQEGHYPVSAVGGPAASAAGGRAWGRAAGDPPHPGSGWRPADMSSGGGPRVQAAGRTPDLPLAERRHAPPPHPRRSTREGPAPARTWPRCPPPRPSGSPARGSPASSPGAPPT